MFKRSQLENEIMILADKIIKDGFGSPNITLETISNWTDDLERVVDKLSNSQVGEELKENLYLREIGRKLFSKISGIGVFGAVVYTLTPELGPQFENHGVELAAILSAGALVASTKETSRWLNAYGTLIETLRQVYLNKYRE